MQCQHAGVIFALVLTAAPAIAQNVKVTPVGLASRRAVRERPCDDLRGSSGVRILYDAGHTVTGGDDPRLGDIHAVLLSHAHGDHIGDQKLKAVGRW